MTYDYFYGQQAEMFAFYRVPKVLFTEDCFWNRQTIYYIVANGDFELIKVGRYKRATKESFEKWYQNQTRYRLVAEDGQERR